MKSRGRKALLKGMRLIGEVLEAQGQEGRVYLTMDSEAFDRIWKLVFPEYEQDGLFGWKDMALFNLYFSRRQCP